MHAERDDLAQCHAASAGVPLPGDASALLRDTDEDGDGMSPVGLTLAASRGRSAAAPVQPASAANVNLTEVRLQLQRQLMQQVSSLCKATGCGGSMTGACRCFAALLDLCRHGLGVALVSVLAALDQCTHGRGLQQLSVCWPHNLQERRIAELESQLAELQQQLEAARSNRTVTQEALDQVSPQPAAAALTPQL